MCGVSVCLPVSLLPHIQAFLTQEDLDMSLSVSTNTLDVLNHVSLYARAALMSDGIAAWVWRLDGSSSIGMPQLKVSKKSQGQSFVSEC